MTTRSLPSGRLEGCSPTSVTARIDGDELFVTSPNS